MNSDGLEESGQPILIRDLSFDGFSGFGEHDYGSSAVTGCIFSFTSTDSAGRTCENNQVERSGCRLKKEEKETAKAGMKIPSTSVVGKKRRVYEKRCVQDRTQTYRNVKTRVMLINITPRSLIQGVEISKLTKSRSHTDLSPSSSANMKLLGIENWHYAKTIQCRHTRCFNLLYVPETSTLGEELFYEHEFHPG